jgi:hypothetical protein
LFEKNKESGEPALVSLLERNSLDFWTPNIISLSSIGLKMKANPATKT